MQLSFPIEFLVPGVPVSSQAQRTASREEWKARVKEASLPTLPAPHFASDLPISITLFYFPDGPMQGDVDNIVKLTIDALGRHIYLDDRQVERVVVQKFEPGNIFGFGNPSAILIDALRSQKPVLYVRVSADPFEDLE